MASRIMRTTIDIDDPILKQLKRLQAKQGKSLGRLVSDLLAPSLARAERAKPPEPAFQWTARPMGVRLDLADKQALWDAMDGRSR